MFLYRSGYVVLRIASAVDHFTTFKKYPFKRVFIINFSFHVDIFAQLRNTKFLFLNRLNAGKDSDYNIVVFIYFLLSLLVFCIYSGFFKFFTPVVLLLNSFLLLAWLHKFTRKKLIYDIFLIFSTTIAYFLQIYNQKLFFIYIIFFSTVVLRSVSFFGVSSK